MSLNSSLELCLGCVTYCKHKALSLRYSTGCLSDKAYCSSHKFDERDAKKISLLELSSLN